VQAATRVNAEQHSVPGGDFAGLMGNRSRAAAGGSGGAHRQSGKRAGLRNLACGARSGGTPILAGDRLLDSADLLITIGYDPVEYWPEEWNKGKARKIVHIHVEPASLDVDYCPTVELTGDIAETLRSLGEATAAGGVLRPDSRDYLGRA
jgi:hypothetical protein